MSRITVDRQAAYAQADSKSLKHTNPIIYGYFPHRTYNEMAITRVNSTLCAILGMFIVISLISYYFVTSSEVTLNIVGKETTKLNNENVELQNKLDNMHSYNNVDQVVRKNNLLNTAKQVMEVPATAAVVKQQNSMPKIVKKDSYKWSVGY